MNDEKETLREKMKSPQWRLAIAVILVLVLMYAWQTFLAPPPKQQVYSIGYSEFLNQVSAGNVNSVSIKGMDVKGDLIREVELTVTEAREPVKVRNFSTRLPSFQGEDLIQRLQEKGVAIDVKPEDESPLWRFMVGVLPWALIIGFWIYIMRRTTRQIGGGPGGLFSFGQSKAKLYDISKPRVTFKDVAGMTNVKKEMQEIIDFLMDPGKFSRIGAEIPKGVLLVGPPGTGKTLLARAVAGEAGVPFHSINASEFIEMFVGVGAARVRDMFRKAKAAKPSLIFIDEIDAVGRTRGAGLGGGHDEREQTLNQLLAEMDGFEPNEGVVIIAATNRPDVLDPALLRPGRFDRIVTIDRPSWEERLQILKVHVRDKKLSEDVDLEKIARGTPGMTGADLENLANEAALTAVRKDKERVETADFEEAKDKILMGTVREDKLSELERRITAYHEAGHTLVAWGLPGTDPIHKVSILPRGMAIGVTQLIPEEDRHYYPKTYLVNRLTVALAGRVAEKLVFNDVSTGAQNDLKEATALAEKMVAQWGMSEKIGPVNLGRGEEHPFLGRELAQPKKYSEDMAWLMDQEIRDFILKAERHAEGILKEHREKLDILAEALLKEETLSREDVEGIIGKPQEKV